jgi:putative spermidine/putrescine transport system permease protein
MNNRDQRLGWPYVFTGLVTLVAAVFLVAPLVILVIQSFTGASYLSFPPPSYGVRWYQSVFASEDWRNSFLLSLGLALLVTPLSLAIGTLASLGLTRGPLKGRRELYAILISPMVLPHIVLGLGIFRIALHLGISDSFWSFVPAHLTITVPFVVVTVTASLQTFDIGLEEAARSLGASPLRAFWHVTIPVISPGLIAGGIFSFIISFDEFIITFFLATFKLTLPLQIFSTLMYQVKPSIAAVSTLMLVLTAVLTTFLIMRGQVVTKGGEIVK